MTTQSESRADIYVCEDDIEFIKSYVLAARSASPIQHDVPPTHWVKEAVAVGMAIGDWVEDMGERVVR